MRDGHCMLFFSWNFCVLHKLRMCKIESTSSIHSSTITAAARITMKHGLALASQSSQSNSIVCCTHRAAAVCVLKRVALLPKKQQQQSKKHDSREEWNKNNSESEKRNYFPFRSEYAEQHNEFSCVRGDFFLAAAVNKKK
jgi:hypothetical protein